MTRHPLSRAELVAELDAIASEAARAHQRLLNGEAVNGVAAMQRIRARAEDAVRNAGYLAPELAAAKSAAGVDVVIDPDVFDRVAPKAVDAIYAVRDRGGNVHDAGRAAAAAVLGVLAADAPDAVDLEHRTTRATDLAPRA